MTENDQKREEFITPFEIQKRDLEKYLDIEELEHLKSHEVVVEILNSFFLGKKGACEEIFWVSTITMNKYLEWEYTEKTHRRIMNALFQHKTKVHNVITMQRKKRD